MGRPPIPTWRGPVFLAPHYAGLRLTFEEQLVTDFSSIALRAYQLWDDAGRPEGRSDEFCGSPGESK